MNRSFRIRNVALILVALASFPASAVELGRPGIDHVFVFSDETGFQVAIEAFKQKNMTTVMKYVRCIVPAGSSAAIVDRPSMSFREIIIVGGSEDGCRGVVPVADLRGD